MQSVPSDTFRSGWLNCTPVSITATLTLLYWRAIVVVADRIRRTPVGGVGSPGTNGTFVAARTSDDTTSPSNAPPKAREEARSPTAHTTLSSLTEATRGSFRNSATCRGDSRAANPFNARLYSNRARKPKRCSRWGYIRRNIGHAGPEHDDVRRNPHTYTRVGVASEGAPADGPTHVEGPNPR